MERKEDIGRMHTAGLTIDFEYGELWRGLHRSNPLSFKRPYSWIVYKDRDVYMAEDWRGRIRYEDDDASEVIKSVRDSDPDVLIFLKNGEYIFSKRVEGKVKLVGESRDGVVIKPCEGYGYDVLFYFNALTDPLIEDVVFENLTLDCSGSGAKWWHGHVSGVFRNLKLIQGTGYGCNVTWENSLLENLYVDGKANTDYHHIMGSLKYSVMKNVKVVNAGKSCVALGAFNYSVIINLYGESAEGVTATSLLHMESGVKKSVVINPVLSGAFSRGINFIKATVTIDHILICGGDVTDATYPVFGWGASGWETVKIVWLKGFKNENGGTVTVTGDGSTTTFTVDIEHGLKRDKVACKITLDREGSIDKVYLVDTNSDGFYETIRVQITYASAPASGEEVPIYWSAEIVD